MELLPMGPAPDDRVAVDTKQWSGALSFDGTGRYLVMAHDYPENKVLVVSLEGRKERVIEGVSATQLLPHPGQAAVFARAYRDVYRLACDTGEVVKLDLGSVHCIGLDESGCLVAIADDEEAQRELAEKHRSDNLPKTLARCRLQPDGHEVADRKALSHRWNRPEVDSLTLQGRAGWLVWWAPSAKASRPHAFDMASGAHFVAPEDGEADDSVPCHDQMDPQGTRLVVVKRSEGRYAATIYDLSRSAPLGRLEDKGLEWYFSSDGRHLLSFSDCLQIWDAGALERLPRELWVGHAHESSRRHAFDHTGKRLALALPGSVAVWALEDLLRVPAPEDSGVSGAKSRVVQSLRGDCLGIVDDSHRLRLLTTGDVKTAVTLRLPEGVVPVTVSRSPSGRHVAWGGESWGLVDLQAVDGPGQEAELEAAAWVGQPEGVQGVVFHPSGQLLAVSALPSRSILLVGVEDRAPLGGYAGSGKDVVFAFSADGRLLASADAAGEVQRWDLAPTLGWFQGLLGRGARRGASQLPKRLLSLTIDDTRRAGDLESPVVTLLPDLEGVTLVQMSGRARRYALSGGLSGDYQPASRDETSGPVLVMSATFSPDGKTLVMATSAHRRLIAVDTRSLTVRWERALPHEVEGLAVQPGQVSRLLIGHEIDGRACVTPWELPELGAPPTPIVPALARRAAEELWSGERIASVPAGLNPRAAAFWTGYQKAVSELIEHARSSAPSLADRMEQIPTIFHSVLLRAARVEALSEAYQARVFRVAFDSIQDAGDAPTAADIDALGEPLEQQLRFGKALQELMEEEALKPDDLRFERDQYLGLAAALGDDVAARIFGVTVVLRCKLALAEHIEAAARAPSEGLQLPPLAKQVCQQLLEDASASGGGPLEASACFLMSQVFQSVAQIEEAKSLLARAISLAEQHALPRLERYRKALAELEG